MSDLLIFAAAAAVIASYVLDKKIVDARTVQVRHLMERHFGVALGAQTHHFYSRPQARNTTLAHRKNNQRAAARLRSASSVCGMLSLLRLSTIQPAPNGIGPGSV